MKRIKIIVTAVLAAATMGLSSCGDDFLTVYHPTQLSEADFYKTESDIMNALVAAYAPLQWEPYSWGWGPSIFVSDVMGDDLLSGSAPNDNPELHLLDDFSVRVSTMGALDRWWVIGFSGVYRANIVVEKLPEIEGLSAEKAARIRAEAIFLRSYYYYNMWRFFGNLPYYETNLLFPYATPQVTADEVYQAVVWGENGLSSIINDLPEELSPADYGRATRAAAQMLKARFVMYQMDEGKFAEVLADMKDIISKGHHALKTTITEDYTAAVGQSPVLSYIPTPFEALYMQEGEFGSETIFDINYTDAGSTQQWDSPTQAGGTIYPTFVGPRSMTANDDYRSGWCFGTVPQATYDMYDDADTRKDGGILNMEKWIANYQESKGISINYDRSYPKETGFYMKKYVSRMGYNTRDSGNGSEDFAFRNNIRIFRYAETLLNAAELAVRAGDTSTAQGYLDQIRDRAYGDTAHRIPATLENVKMERRKEFVGDGIRYWDLVRWGDANSVLGPLGWKSNVTINGVPRWLFPIGESEINRAASTIYPLTQNPGY